SDAADGSYGDITELLLQFESEICDGRAPSWGPYLSQCSNAAMKAELLVEMIRSEQGHVGWQPQLAIERWQQHSEADCNDERTGTLARALYSDQIEADNYPVLSDFENLGSGGRMDLLGLDGN